MPTCKHPTTLSKIIDIVTNRNHRPILFAVRCRVFEHTKASKILNMQIFNEQYAPMKCVKLSKRRYSVSARFSEHRYRRMWEINEKIIEIVGKMVHLAVSNKDGYFIRIICQMFKAESKRISIKSFKIIQDLSQKPCSSSWRTEWLRCKLNCLS